MSVTFSVKPLVTNRASAALTAEMAKLTPRRMNAALGPRISLLVKRNFLNLPQNRRGYPSTHFWSDAARATNWQVLPEGVLISVNKIGVRQRYHGGTIRPVNAKALALPISPLSYGKIPADFGDALQVVVTKEKKAFLVAKSASGEPVFLFALVAKVDQEPNPAVLPDTDEIATAATQAIMEAIK